MKMSRRPSERRCPFCDNPMLVVTSEAPVLELEACRSCNAVWFDNPTYESLPQLTSETLNSIPMQATELIAMDRLRELKERMEEERKAAQKKKRLHRNSADDTKDRRSQRG
jgi:Zn-finger nucleic acid-binding protein